MADCRSGVSATRPLTMVGASMPETKMDSAKSTLTPSGRRDTTSSEDGSPPPAKPDVTVAPSSGFPQPVRPSPGADEWSRAASAHPPFRFLVSQAGAALHLDRGSFTGVPRQLMSLSIHRGGCPGRYPRPWATTTALSPYRTPECSRRSRSYTDRRGDGCSVRHLSPLPGVGRDCWGGAWKVSPGPISPSTLSRSTASTIAAVAPTPDPMAGVRAVSLSPITSCADPPGSRWLRPFGPFPDRLLSPVSFEITAHHWAEVRRARTGPNFLMNC